MKSTCLHLRALQLSAIALGLLSLPARAFQSEATAEEEALVPLPSVLDFTGGDGWGIALGLGVEYESAYDGSDEYELGIEPAGAVQWRSGNHLLFWEGLELGWRGRLDREWLLQANLRWEGGREASDSDEGYLDGLEDRDDELVGVLEARYGLGRDWRGWVGGRVMGGSSDFGLLGVLAAGYRFGEQLDGTGTELLAFSTFGSSTFINKDFGVTASESAASGLAETDLDGGYRSSGLTLLHRRWLLPDLQLIAQAGVELYSSAISDSPIARESYEGELALSLVYRF
jgi:outer membrane scaffolding protein for murein synthesis (MipA/OmpV family)